MELFISEPVSEGKTGDCDSCLIQINVGFRGMIKERTEGAFYCSHLITVTLQTSVAINQCALFPSAPIRTKQLVCVDVCCGVNIVTDTVVVIIFLLESASGLLCVYVDAYNKCVYLFICQHKDLSETSLSV